MTRERRMFDTGPATEGRWRRASKKLNHYGAFSHTKGGKVYVTPGAKEKDV